MQRGEGDEVVLIVGIDVEGGMADLLLTNQLKSTLDLQEDGP